MLRDLVSTGDNARITQRDGFPYIFSGKVKVTLKFCSSLVIDAPNEKIVFVARVPSFYVLLQLPRVPAGGGTGCLREKRNNMLRPGIVQERHAQSLIDEPRILVQIMIFSRLEVY